MRQTGFTLVELSIVLVIIGLITGGVLVGQDMIESAKIKSQIRQLEEYEAAVRAFQTKYGHLPGDCGDICDSDGFGLTPDNLADNGTSIVHNNGRIEGTANQPTQEAGNTFIMMQGAGFIADDFDIRRFPKPVLATTDWFRVALASDVAKNLYWMFGASATGHRYCNAGSCVTGYQSWKLDSILDDANPSAGVVRGAMAANTSWPMGSTAQTHDYLRGLWAITMTGPTANCVDYSTGTGVRPGRNATSYVIDGTIKDCNLVIKID